MNIVEVKYRSVLSLNPKPNPNPHIDIIHISPYPTEYHYMILALSNPRNLPYNLVYRMQIKKSLLTK
jgi:hypothetical protein